MNATVSSRDWALFVALTIMWGSAFGMIELALSGMPSEAVVTGRLGVAAILLNVIRIRMGQALPARADRRVWSGLFAMALFSSVLPFLAVAKAQESVSSSLAGLFMACTPILVALGAHLLFDNEKLSWRTAAGIAIGFVGMVLMIGPDTFGEIAEGQIGAKVLLIAAASFYATSTLIARGMPSLPPLVFTAAFVTLAAGVSVAFLPFADWSKADFNAVSLLGVIGLGVVPSALAQIGYIQLVRSAGATFLSLTNYTIPLWAALVGWIAFDDRVEPLAWMGFALILAGVWLARRKRPVMETG